jgi:hypothetical protein
MSLARRQMSCTAPFSTINTQLLWAVTAADQIWIRLQHLFTWISVPTSDAPDLANRLGVHHQHARAVGSPTAP